MKLHPSCTKPLIIIIVDILCNTIHKHHKYINISFSLGNPLVGKQNLPIVYS